MTDDPVRTQVRTDDGWLEFQEYFVHRHQEPDGPRGPVRRDRPAHGRPPEVGAALGGGRADRHRAVEPDRVDRPDPRGPRHARRCSRQRARGGTPVVAVSPIVGGQALKGPADRMLVSLGHEASALGVARLYAGLVDGFVLDTVDADLAPAIEALGHARPSSPTRDDRRRGRATRLAARRRSAIRPRTRSPGLSRWSTIERHAPAKAAATCRPAHGRRARPRPRGGEVAAGRGARRGGAPDLVRDLLDRTIAAAAAVGRSPRWSW